VLLLWGSWKILKIKTQEVKIIRFICPKCNRYLGKDLEKIDDQCPNKDCLVKIEKFDFALPDPYLTHFQ